VGSEKWKSSVFRGHSAAKTPLNYQVAEQRGRNREDADPQPSLVNVKVGAARCLVSALSLGVAGLTGLTAPAHPQTPGCRSAPGNYSEMDR
jgi:hypothetical protein